MRRIGFLAAAVAATLTVPGIAGAQVRGPLDHAGRWITDADGRVVILHGVNMVYKRPPYDPAVAGFGADDAAFLEQHGFNTVRLGTIYAAVEPEPGRYDDAYLAAIERLTDLLGRHGVYSQIDFHQDLYNERFQGEGWPDWAVQDDGLPAEPRVGFPGNYLVMPALWRAFDHFWDNDPGPGGVGLQDRYAEAWGHVAARFRDNPATMGYDLLNEPWPGSPWPTCANTAGCPAFDTGPLAAFNRRMIRAIREEDPDGLVWYEPLSTFNSGANTSLPETGDEHAGMSFHIYCLRGQAMGSSGEDPLGSLDCPVTTQLVHDNAEDHSRETGDALLLSEFGATDDLAEIRRQVDIADRNMVSWQYWHYCGCDDPTTSGPAGQAVVVDANLPPTGDNVRRRKLAVLSRPYPQAVAGTPLRYAFDQDSRSFVFEQTTSGPGGGSVRPGLLTEIFTAPVHYPTGYQAAITGGRAASATNAAKLLVEPAPGAARVGVRLRPTEAGLAIAEAPVRVSRTGRAGVTVRCLAPDDRRCEGTLALARGGRELGRARFSIRGGGSRLARVRLSRAARRLVARAGRLTVRARATGQAGPAHDLVAVATLRVRRSR